MRPHEAWIPPTKRLLRAPLPHRCDLHPNLAHRWAPAQEARERPPLPGAALEPPPGPVQPIPAQLPPLRKPEGGRPVSRLQAGPGRQHPRRHSSLPRGASLRLRNQPGRAEQSAQGRQPASRPRWGRGRCYLPWARPLPAGAALLATAAATRRPGAEGPSDSSQRALRPRPRRRRRRRPSIPAPGPCLASRR